MALLVKYYIPRSGFFGQFKKLKDKKTEASRKKLNTQAKNSRFPQNLEKITRKY